MKNDFFVRYAFLVATFFVMHSTAWALNESALTLSNQTNIRVSVSYEGVVLGGAFLNPGQIVSGGLPGAVPGVGGLHTITVSVDSIFRTVAECSANVDTARPVLALITGSTGTYRCVIQNTNKVTAVLNTSMEDYTPMPLTIVEHLNQNGQSLKTDPQQIAANNVKDISTRLLSTSPVMVTEWVYGAGGKLVATCSATVSFNLNLFYTTVRVLADSQKSSGYSCSAW